MPKRTGTCTVEKKSLYISRDDYERILMWSQSQKEILFVCLGTKNSIKKVVRLGNYARDPKNYSFWSDFAFKWSVNRHKIACQKIIAYGHSHPSKRHDAHPSRVDLKFSTIGEIELIAFPAKNEVRAWKLGSNIKATLRKEIILKILTIC
ncbi:MAG: hypothetical protein AB7I27_19190 [Bacteriovoracaceae bacterium]